MKKKGSKTYFMNNSINEQNLKLDKIKGKKFMKNEHGEIMVGVLNIS